MPFIYSELRILPPASINKTFNFSFLSQIFLLQILLKILRYYLKAISPIPIFHKLCCLSCFQGAKKSTSFSSCEKNDYCQLLHVFFHFYHYNLPCKFYNSGLFTKKYQRVNIQFKTSQSEIIIMHDENC